MKVAVITPKPVKTDMSELFGLEVDQYALTSQNVKRVLMRDVDIEIDINNYEWVILIGSEPLKYYSTSTAIGTASGTRVEAKPKKDWSGYEGFLACLNPAAMFFRPEIKPQFEEAKERLQSHMDGTFKPPAECDYRIWAEGSEDLNAYIKQITEDDSPVIALDSETSALYPRKGEILGISISHKERQGVYAHLDCIDEDTLVLIQDLLDNPNKHFVLHNAKFDINWFNLHLDTCFDKAFAEGRVHDSMIQHYVLDERPGHGLKPLAIKYTDMGNYDAELDIFKKEYCKVNKIKQADFSYSFIPFETLSDYACLSKSSKVLLGDGKTWEDIDRLVRDKYAGTVMSRNLTTGEMESKPVTGWYKNTHKSKEWRKIVYTYQPKGLQKVGSNAVQGPTFTPDHRLLTQRGWVEIQDLKSTDRIAQDYNALSKDSLALIMGCLLGDGRLESRNGKGAGFEFSQAGTRTDLVSELNNLLGGKLDIIRASGNRTESLLLTTGYSHEYTDMLAELNFDTGSSNQKLLVDSESYKYLTVASLAMWYFSDGNLPGEALKPRIWRRTLSGNVEQQRAVLDWLLSLGVEAHYHDDGISNQFFVIDNPEYFYGIVAPYATDGVSYKIPPQYQCTKSIWDSIEARSDQPYFAKYESIEQYEPKDSQRGYATSWCIDVQDNHNFVTKIGIVHNCRDTDATIRLHNKFYPLVKKNARLKELYENLLMPAVRFLARMEDRGVPVSIPRVRAAQKELHAKVFEAEEELYKCKEVIAFEAGEGQKFNPQSPIQMRKLLFDYGDYQPTGKLTDTGEISCDAEVLQTLAEFGELPKVLLKIRKNAKLLSSFINKIMDNVDTDSRVRTGFNLATTTSGRLSSSGTINLQQLPRDNPIVKGCITAPAGYRIVAWD